MTCAWYTPIRLQDGYKDLNCIIIIIIIIIEKHTSEGAKEQTQHKLSYMVEAEDTIKSNSD